MQVSSFVIIKILLKMGLKKGQTNNRNGRPKGAKNKRTLQWEALGEAIITTHAERFNDVLSTLDDDDFVKAYGMIVQYFRPKQTHNINEEKKPISIVFENHSDKFKFDDNGESIEQ